MVIFTAQFHKTKTEIRFWPGSNSAIAMSEVCDGENLTRWSRPDLRLSLINHSAKAIHHYIPFLTIILDITHFTNQEIILKRLYMWNCLFSLVNQHCVKSVQIRSFFWSVFSHIRTEYGEIMIHVVRKGGSSCSTSPQTNFPPCLRTILSLVLL